MKRTNKGLYGFFAFGPIALILIAFIGMFGMLAANDGRRIRGSEEAILFFFLGLMIVAAILSLASMIMYIIHMARSPYIDDGARIGWIIGMFFANGIVQIIYFFVYIAKEDQLEADRMARINYQTNQNFGEGRKSNPFD